jgi:hypothetical protein
VTSGSIVRASVAAALLVLGCGGGTDPADAFVGTRTFMFSGIDSAGPCVPGGSDVLIDLSGAMMTITKDDRTDITATFAANGAACDLGFTVRGAGATVKTGQSCSISDAAMSGTFEITSGSLNLYSTFLLLSLDGGFVPAGATSATCLLSAADTLPAP